MKLIWDTSELDHFVARLDGTTNFNAKCKAMAEEIAQLLRQMIVNHTPSVTTELKQGWNGDNLMAQAQRVKNGFKVTLVNKVPYALYVNDGHRVRNDEKGPYLQVKRRVKVPVAKQWQSDASDWYVFGHFFVEEGVIATRDNAEIEQIIYKHLTKWWEGLF